jgi:c-di-GMP-binding flagellar brake protein YcgR
MDQHKTDNPTDFELLASGCERNTPVEIHKHTGEAAIPVARARMMCIDDERLYLDEPQTIGRQVRMGKNTGVDAYFAIGEALYTFTTTVASMHCKVKLNESKTLIGMALNLPSDIKQGQRRSRYRTSLAMQAPIPMTMHHASKDLNSAPIDADRYQGRLVDASEGGFGVMLDIDRPMKFKLFDRWIVRFQIPGEGDPTTLGCELRQVRTIREGEMMKLGLLALPWPTTRALREQMLPMTRYLTSVERRLLKRVS